MKRTVTFSLIGFTAILAHSALAFNPVVNQTVGTGANISYFVINFNDGPNFANNPASNYVFGYRYDGAKTGEDIITTLEGSLATFTATQTYYASFGDYFTTAFSYNGLTQTSNYSLNKSYWAYWTSTDARLSQSTSDWTADNGPLEHALVSNTYDGWTFAANGITPKPVTAPEPSALIVLAIGTLGVVCLRRRIAAGR